MSIFSTQFKLYQPITKSHQSCSFQKCEILPQSICHHCEHYFCSDHRNEHENRCSQTPAQLLEKLNKLTDQLSSIEPYCYEQIERWRDKAYQTIDQYCEKKRHEIIESKQEICNKQLDYFGKKLEELIQEDVISTFRCNQIYHDIQLIEVKLIELDHLRLKLRPLNIEENAICVQQLFPLPHAHHSIHLKSGNESSIGSNEHYLLIQREEKYLCLLDHRFSIVHQIPFTFDRIHCICWSSTLNRFIIITFKEIFTFDDQNMIIEQCSISNDVEWWRGTCSNDTLYLSTTEWGSSIYEFDLLQSFQLNKVWSSPVTCERDEIISDLKYNNEFLALAIHNKHKNECHLDLRSSTTLDCVWSINIQGRCRCFPINGDQWLVMDHDDCRLYHISADGKLLKTDTYQNHQKLEDIATWNEHTIVILTKKAIHLHEIY